VALVWVSKVLKKGANEDAKDFISLVQKWSQPGQAGILNPSPIMTAFVLKYLIDRKYLKGQQEVECIFESFTEDPMGNRPGMMFFDFLRPTTNYSVWTSKCCNTNNINMVTGIQNQALCLLDFPKANVSLEKAVDDYFSQPVQVQDHCLQCQKPVTKYKLINVIDAKEGLVVALNRVIVDSTPDKAKKNNALVELGGDICIAKDVLFMLSAAIQHIGPVSSGHYVTHVSKAGQFFCINDDKKITRSRLSDLQKSQVFLYTKIK
jgi:hypothetical protein